MLPTTDAEVAHIKDYMASQAPDLEVTFLQKLHRESILGHVHDAWDVHCSNKERWWVITNPTNLYSQEQFPQLDLAVTFHVGLCLRIPRSEKRQIDELSAEPFAACLRRLSEAHDALSQAEEVSDFQAIGVRCRETMLVFIDAAQIVLPWASTEKPPQRGNLKAWADHLCNTLMPGDTHKERRGVHKTLLKEAWDFDSWRTRSDRCGSTLRWPSRRPNTPLARSCHGSFVTFAGCRKLARPAARTISRPSAPWTSTNQRHNGKGRLAASVAGMECLCPYRTCRSHPSQIAVGMASASFRPSHCAR